MYPDIRDRHIFTARCLRSVELLISPDVELVTDSMRPALAAVTFLRSLAGFGFPLFAPAMYNALGYGKGDTILAAFAIAVGIPSCVVLLLHRLKGSTHSDGI